MTEQVVLDPERIRECGHVHIPWSQDRIGFGTGASEQKREWVVLESTDARLLVGPKIYNQRAVCLKSGVRLRLDGSDYDHLDNEGWHRFYVLSGEIAGSCVVIYTPYGSYDPPPTVSAL